VVAGMEQLIDGSPVKVIDRAVIEKDDAEEPPR
jgi:hypothetical protein